VTELNEWDSFYVIMGSAAGALIGLQFVVMTLISSRPSVRVAEAGAAFGTPTIVHFCAVLFLSALLQAPWRSITWPAILWCLTGCGGIVYMLIVSRRMRQQHVYQPVLEDWLFHAVLPLAAYAMLTFSPLAIQADRSMTFFSVATAALLLLFTGIHNAWDAVAYHVFVKMHETSTEHEKKT
jgi:hypothetical protein